MFKNIDEIAWRGDAEGGPSQQGTFCRGGSSRDQASFIWDNHLPKKSGRGGSNAWIRPAQTSANSGASLKKVSGRGGGERDGIRSGNIGA